MSEPIYILRAVFNMDLGFNHRQEIDFWFYFKTYGEAEKNVDVFKDKAIRKFKMMWRLDEMDNDFTCEVIIKERHLFNK